MAPRTRTHLARVVLTTVVLSTACGGGSPSRQDARQLPPTAPPSSPTVTEGSTLSEAERDQLAMVQRAIEDGFDLNRADDAGRTLLMMASFEGLDAVVGLLLDNGAALDQRDAQGRTALMFAASGPFPDTVELLLRHGATVDAVDATEGWTPLMFAAGEGQLEVVEVLLTHGADPCLTDDDGDAAADHASVQGHDALAESLARTCNE